MRNIILHMSDFDWWQCDSMFFQTKCYISKVLCFLWVRQENKLPALLVVHQKISYHWLERELDLSAWHEKTWEYLILQKSDNISDMTNDDNKCQFDIQGDPQKYPYFSLAITFTKIRELSRYFLHSYWKFIELFFWKPL